MDFQTTAITRQRKQRITLDIDVIGDEVDFAQCEKIADSFTAFISQVWWLADPKFEFSCSSMRYSASTQALEASAGAIAKD